MENKTKTEKNSKSADSAAAKPLKKIRRYPENPYPGRSIQEYPYIGRSIRDPIKPKSLIYVDSRVYTRGLV